jgi:membrane dipeptidase
LKEHMGLVAGWLGESAPHSTSEPTADSSGQPDSSTVPPLGLILAMEGADPILSADDLAPWWNRGLRAVGLSHYGESRYAVGTGADGPITALGRELLKTMSSYPFILDLTHLSDTSFRQAIELYDGPVMASHNNCRELVPGDRQFDDKQITAVFKRGGVIGVALDAWMLYHGWTRGSTSTGALDLGIVANHIDHMCQLAGTSCRVAIGSDLDGGFGSEQTPGDVKSIADLQKLADILSQRGYSESEVRGVFYRNWLHFLLQSLPG